MVPVRWMVSSSEYQPLVTDDGKVVTGGVCIVNNTTLGNRGDKVLTGGENFVNNTNLGKKGG